MRIKKIYFLQVDSLSRPAAANPIPDGGFEAEMQNFKELLNKIREIMDGICSQTLL